MCFCTYCNTIGTSFDLCVAAGDDDEEFDDGDLEELPYFSHVFP